MIYQFRSFSCNLETEQFYQNFCGPWQWRWEKQICLSLSAGQNFCHGTDKGVLMSHADYCQGVTDIGFFKLDHMVQTLNFLGFLEHLATLMPEVRWWRNADKSSADFIRGLQSHSFADKRHLLWYGSNSCPVAQLSGHSIDNWCFKIWSGSNGPGKLNRGNVDSVQEQPTQTV